MSARRFALAGALLLTSAACGVAPQHRNAPQPAAPPEPNAISEAALARQIVRKGDMGVEVDSVTGARTRLERAATALDAQVANLRADEKDRADYVLRVPADKLDALMDSAAALGTVQQRTVSAEDVTDRMVDAAARLISLRASRDRLRQLLDRATSVTDVVFVERELARVQSELESLEARMQALEGQVALSELSVHLRRRIVPGPLAVVALGAGKVISKLFIWR